MEGYIFITVWLCVYVCVYVCVCYLVMHVQHRLDIHFCDRINQALWREEAFHSNVRERTNGLG